MLKEKKSQYIIQQLFEEELIEVQFQSFAEQKRSEQQFILHADNNLKKVYKENTSLAYIYVNSIDQEATRLEG